MSWNVCLALLFFLVFCAPCHSFLPRAKPLGVFRTTTDETPTTKHNNKLLASPQSEESHVETILFVECGFGADAHGQDPTKAAVRACRNAIEFNQIPSIASIVPGGREEMKLDVLLAVPPKYQEDLNLDPIRDSFPYGQVRIQIQDGGMVATNGKIIEAMGDKNEDMVIVCCAVTVGY